LVSDSYVKADKFEHCSVLAVGNCTVCVE